MWIWMLLACGVGSSPSPVVSPPSPDRHEEPGAEPRPAAVVAHAGVGSGPERAGACRLAVDASLAALAQGAEPLDAAVAGVRVLEDDPRLNAGTGSVVRVDGDRVQMDAAVMNSGGDFGAVAVIEGVQHPIDVARAVVDTPHLLLAGEGAITLARRLGIPEYNPATEARTARAAELREQLERGDPALDPAWRAFGWPPDVVLRPDESHDTVGVVVRGADGSFAAALSTGGTPITLSGRVGDVPILGAGMFAGPKGAVAATGKGECIVRAGISRTLHGAMAQTALEPLLEMGVDQLDDCGSIGLIGITAGEGRVCGHDVATDIAAVRRLLSVCPQHSPVYGGLTVGEHLALFGAVRGHAQGRVEEESGALLAALGLQQLPPEPDGESRKADRADAGSVRR